MRHLSNSSQYTDTRKMVREDFLTFSQYAEERSLFGYQKSKTGQQIDFFRWLWQNIVKFTEISKISWPRMAQKSPNKKKVCFQYIC